MQIKKTIRGTPRKNKNNNEQRVPEKKFQQRGREKKIMFCQFNPKKISFRFPCKTMLLKKILRSILPKKKIKKNNLRVAEKKNLVRRVAEKKFVRGNPHHAPPDD